MHSQTGRSERGCGSITVASGVSPLQLNLRCPSDCFVLVTTKRNTSVTSSRSCTLWPRQGQAGRVSLCLRAKCSRARYALAFLHVRRREREAAASARVSTRVRRTRLRPCSSQCTGLLVFLRASLVKRGAACEAKLARQCKLSPKAAFSDLLRHQHHAGPAAAAPGEHPSAWRHDYT